jgi:hypothetical protein
VVATNVKGRAYKDYIALSCHAPASEAFPAPGARETEGDWLPPMVIPI